MPANLTPEYSRADERYRRAASDAERIAALQEMLATIPKHKGTEKMQADLKHRLAQLRREAQTSEHGKGPDPFHIPKSGAGQVVLIGPPNAGKSSLLNATTQAGARVAAYPFTTSLPQPGIWRREGIPLELIDTPPLLPDHVVPGLLGTIRGADIVALVVAAADACLSQVADTEAILAARGVTLRTIPVRRIPAPESGLRSGLVIANQVDLGGRDAAAALRCRLAGRLEVLEVSAATGTGLEAWFRRLRDLLEVIRVYAKEPGKPPETDRPFVLPAGSTVVDLARLIHRDLPRSMRQARLWGHGRFAGQPVPREEPLQDGDAVEIHE